MARNTPPVPEENADDIIDLTELIERGDAAPVADASGDTQPGSEDAEIEALLAQMDASDGASFTQGPAAPLDTGPAPAHVVDPNEQLDMSDMGDIDNLLASLDIPPQPASAAAPEAPAPAAAPDPGAGIPQDIQQDLDAAMDQLLNGTAPTPPPAAPAGAPSVDDLLAAATMPQAPAADPGIPDLEADLDALLADPALATQAQSNAAPAEPDLEADLADLLTTIHAEAAPAAAPEAAAPDFPEMPEMPGMAEMAQAPVPEAEPAPDILPEPEVAAATVVEEVTEVTGAEAAPLTVEAVISGAAPEPAPAPEEDIIDVEPELPPAPVEEALEAAQPEPELLPVPEEDIVPEEPPMAEEPAAVAPPEEAFAEGALVAESPEPAAEAATEAPEMAPDMAAPHLAPEAGGQAEPAMARPEPVTSPGADAEAAPGSAAGTEAGRAQTLLQANGDFAALAGALAERLRQCEADLAAARARIEALEHSAADSVSLGDLLREGSPLHNGFAALIASSVGQALKDTPPPAHLPEGLDARLTSLETRQKSLLARMDAVEQRLDSLEPRFNEEVGKAAASAVARILREEISRLAGGEA